jgi:hypothetical protein
MLQWIYLFWTLSTNGMTNIHLAFKIASLCLAFFFTQHSVFNVHAGCFSEENIFEVATD